MFYTEEILKAQVGKLSFDPVALESVLVEHREARNVIRLPNNQLICSIRPNIGLIELRGIADKLLGTVESTILRVMYEIPTSQLIEEHVTKFGDWYYGGVITLPSVMKGFKVLQVIEQFGDESFFKAVREAAGYMGAKIEPLALYRYYSEI